MEINNGKIKLYISVVPNSSSTRIKYFTDDEIKIEIDEAPENNKANIKLVKFLTKLLKLPKDAISLIGGFTSRKKVVLITCEANCEKIKEILQSNSE